MNLYRVFVKAGYDQIALIVEAYSVMEAERAIKALFGDNAGDVWAEQVAEP